MSKIELPPYVAEALELMSLYGPLDQDDWLPDTWEEMRIQGTPKLEARDFMREKGWVTIARNAKNGPVMCLTETGAAAYKALGC